MKTIVLTGGGTAGHVYPNLALIPALKKEGFNIVYIGSKDGIERKIVKEQNIPYYSVPTGKLRRYLSFKNLSDMLKAVTGSFKASSLIKEIKPDIVFSKGGFVGFPVVIGAKLNRIPVIIHESDLTPGLANKLALPFANAVCVNFPETKQYIKRKKSYLTGNPIRNSLFLGDKRNGLKYCGFNDDKPVILCMGGSLGAAKINEVLREAIPRLCKKFNIIHICGKGKVSDEHKGIPGYIQFDYISDRLPDVIAASDVVLSRAGAGAIAELIALKKPHLLIPLSLNASRGDQILNAKSCQKRGFSMVLDEEEMTAQTLEVAIEKLYSERDGFIRAMKENNTSNAVLEVINVLKEYV